MNSRAKVHSITVKHTFSPGRYVLSRRLNLISRDIFTIKAFFCEIEVILAIFRFLSFKAGSVKGVRFEDKQRANTEFLDFYVLLT